MRYGLLLSLSLLLLLCVVGLGVAQIQTAKIVVKGISPDILAKGRYDALSSGLPNVGKGQKVWLEAHALFTTDSVLTHSYLDTIITETWTLTNPPGGVASITHTDTTTYFVPDTTGEYKVELSITTANGPASATVYISSGYWVGVGNITGPPSFSKGECAACHPDKENTWKGTGHSRIFSFNVDSSDHYSESCVPCHSVGYDKSPTAVNGGWDDVDSVYGFSIPSPQHPGVWDSIKTNFPLLANVSNVQCENCHGPGSLHKGNTTNNKIAVTLSAEMCSECHGRAMHHIKSYEWNNSVHSKTTAEGSQVEALNGSSCARCHTANGYVNETIDKNPPAAPYADVQPISCAACHDPHDAKNPAQLRSPSIATACDGCHLTRISGHGVHNNTQSPMLNGVTGTSYSGQTGVGAWGGWLFPGYTYTNSSHSKITDRCATCHMATVNEANLADTAMVPAPFTKWQGQLGGHTFKVVWDAGTPDDESDDLLNPFGCKDCHGTVSLDFVKQTQAKTKALLEQLRVLLPHNTSGDTTLPLPPATSSLTPTQKAASYNWYFVNNDGSFGVHNFEYAAGLLRSSIDMVNLGAGAASIASITDVPNDQGKQVQIVWNKFPAESYPTEPVISYMVLRMDSAAAMSPSTVIAKLYLDMLDKVARGSDVVLAGAVWTNVGEYKAVNLPKYSLVVPTLFDSTIVGGMKQTTFEVVGYTAGKTVYASAPLNGYSVDNLAPLPPAGVAATTGAGLVHLTWNKPVDLDVKYVAVYRGTTPGFTPTSPLQTTGGTSYTDNGVVVGSTYYYKLAAFDFSGNESQYSNEVPVIVTAVTETGGIPTEYALQQNNPNPFNPSTLIRYQVPEAAHVRIQIYNTLGSLIATVVDREMNPGYHTVVWDGRDFSGNAVASGIYLYKMEAGNFSSVRKMMLLK
jgi:predicted CXXCH cytochrome family protein